MSITYHGKLCQASLLNKTSATKTCYLVLLHFKLGQQLEKNMKTPTYTSHHVSTTPGDLCYNCPLVTWSK